MTLTTTSLIPPIFHPLKHFTATTTTSIQTPPPPQSPPHSSIHHSLSTNLLSLALTVTLTASPFPAQAISSLNSSPAPLLPTTPFAQSKKLLTGLENGKIRACPSINPGCVSTNPQSSSFAFPWTIPQNAVENAAERLQEAILSTQKNATIKVVEDTPYGKYLLAEVDGGFGSKDVLEFLIKGDVASYRAMANKVTYLYPFTTALGDSKGQEERVQKILDQLGWDAPRFDAMDVE